MKAYKVFKMCVLVVLALTANGLAINQSYYGGTSNDWAYYDNWWSGTVPAAGDMVGVTDATNRSGFPGSGSLTIYSGTNAVCADFGMEANGGSGGNQSLTIKSGASLTVGVYNFELAYTAGPESGTLNLEAGGALTVAGYFLNWHRAAPQFVNVAGTITANSMGFDKTSQVAIDFTAATGKIIVANIPEGDVSWYAGNWLPYMRDQGIAFGEAGWNLGATWADGKMTLGHIVPEPASMILLGLGGLALLRKRK